ncbi:MAG TPA: ComEC/Rec2 family competence protein, partial [Anaerolineales bacterium]|nr:ComEC/Rec2 family competence protein [Anaerolineales bacterium]
AEGVSISAVIEARTIRRLVSPGPSSAAARLDGLRDHIVDRLEEVLPAAEASLVAGVLLGADEHMPEPVLESFRATGTAHILAVSGFNVTIVAAAAATVFGRTMGARRGAAAAAASVVLYTLLCGAEPAVVRAALMACIGLVALRLGRQPAALASLAGAAILMTLFQPAVVSDVGFQLSFLATLGLVLAGRPAQEAIRRWGERAIPGETARLALLPIVEVAALSLVAQAATLPLSAYVFHRLPLTSLPANALILPAQPALMAAGAVTAAASLVSLPLGHALAWITWPLAAYTLRVADRFAHLPGASLVLPPVPSLYVVAAYAALAGAIALARLPQARKAANSLSRFRQPFSLVALAALVLVTWRFAVERPDGRLHVTAFPGGDVLIESPTGRFLAVNAGPSLAGLLASLDEHMPLTSPALDAVILLREEPSPQEILDGLGRHRPGHALLAASGSLWSEGLREVAPVEVIPAASGVAMDLGGQARLEILGTAGRGRTLRVTFGSAVIVISSDERLASGSSGAASGASAVVLLGEGRQVAGLMQGEWSSGRPLVLVAAPSPGEAWDLEPAPGQMLATPSYGWIRLSSDGARLAVRTERTP